MLDSAAQCSDRSRDICYSVSYIPRPWYMIEGDPEYLELDSIKTVGGWS